MLKLDQSLSDLQSMHANHGRLVWIGIRSGHRQPAILQESVTLLAGRGIEGDHIAKRNSKKRQITLIQAEHFPVIAKLANIDSIQAEQLRRNLVIEGINLQSLKGKKFTIGDCILEGTGPCHPCSRMEETLGTGGYNAMRGHGGITAIIRQGGIIKIGDFVSLSE